MQSDLQSVVWLSHCSLRKLDSFQWILDESLQHRTALILCVTHVPTQCLSTTTMTNHTKGKGHRFIPNFPVPLRPLSIPVVLSLQIIQNRTTPTQTQFWSPHIPFLSVNKEASDLVDHYGLSYTNSSVYVRLLTRVQPTHRKLMEAIQQCYGGYLFLVFYFPNWAWVIASCHKSWLNVQSLDLGINASCTIYQLRQDVMFFVLRGMIGTPNKHTHAQLDSQVTAQPLGGH